MKRCIAVLIVYSLFHITSLYGGYGESSKAASSVTLLQYIQASSDKPVHHLIPLLQPPPPGSDQVYPQYLALNRHGISRAPVLSETQKSAISKLLGLYAENPGNSPRMLKLHAVLDDLRAQSQAGNKHSSQILHDLEISDAKPAQPMINKIVSYFKTLLNPAPFYQKGSIKRSLQAGPENSVSVEDYERSLEQTQSYESSVMAPIAKSRLRASHRSATWANRLLQAAVVVSSLGVVGALAPPISMISPVRNSSDSRTFSGGCIMQCPPGAGGDCQTSLDIATSGSEGVCTFPSLPSFASRSNYCKDQKVQTKVTTKPLPDGRILLSYNGRSLPDAGFSFTCRAGGASKTAHLPASVEPAIRAERDIVPDAAPTHRLGSNNFTDILSQHLNSRHILVENITLSHEQNSQLPLASSGVPFTGSLFHNGYWINNLTISQNNTDTPVALIRDADSATIDVQLNAPHVTGGSASTAAVVARVGSNNTITGRIHHGRVSGHFHTGLLTAFVEGSGNELELKNSHDNHIRIGPAAGTSGIANSGGGLVAAHIAQGENTAKQNNISDSSVTSSISGSQLGLTVGRSTGSHIKVIQKSVRGSKVTAYGKDSHAALNVGQHFGNDGEIIQYEVVDSQVELHGPDTNGALNGGWVSGDRIKVNQKRIYRNRVTATEDKALIGLQAGTGGGADAEFEQSEADDNIIESLDSSGPSTIAMNTANLGGTRVTLNQTSVRGTLRGAGSAVYAAPNAAIIAAGKKTVIQRETVVHIIVPDGPADIYAGASLGRISQTEEINYQLFSGKTTRSDNGTVHPLGVYLPEGQRSATGIVDATGFVGGEIVEGELEPGIPDTLKILDTRNS